MKKILSSRRTGRFQVEGVLDSLQEDVWGDLLILLVLPSFDGSDLPRPLSMTKRQTATPHAQEHTKTKTVYRGSERQQKTTTRRSTSKPKYETHAPTAFELMGSISATTYFST